MKIAVIGSTGRTGRLLLAEGLRRGHSMTAFTRRPEELEEVAGLQAIVHGDGRILDNVRQAVQGQDIVISIVNAGRAGPGTVATDVTRTVITAMQEAGVRRLVCVSAYPVVATRPWLAIKIIRWIFRHTYADLANMEPLVKASGLDWTIIRPTQLTNGPATRHVRYERIHPEFSSGPYTISRADVATALLDVAETTHDAGVALAVTAGSH